MINPINKVNYQGYYNSPFILKQKQAVQSDKIQLSGNSAEQGVLARNNICFREQERIIPLASVYNQPLKNNYTEFCYRYESNKKNDNLA